MSTVIESGDISFLRLTKNCIVQQSLTSRLHVRVEVIGYMIYAKKLKILLDSL